MLEREEQQRGSENKNSLEIGGKMEKDGEEAQQGPVRWASIALCWGGRCLLNIAINRLNPNQCFDQIILQKTHKYTAKRIFHTR